MFRKPISQKAALFTESVIREMTRLAIQHEAINLSQGFPDFAAPPELKKAAADAIFADVNQYAVTWGAKKFRDAIAAKTSKSLGIEFDRMNLPRHSASAWFLFGLVLKAVLRRYSRMGGYRV